ncbi:hypothetical protein WPG_1550 [Winogradskyella sp. PG-2]|nr:hypothetical protein WPG_1550 [Winogradskyella sp. PG-2]
MDKKNDKPHMTKPKICGRYAIPKKKKAAPNMNFITGTGLL